jgi:hypothetical protein
LASTRIRQTGEFSASTRIRQIRRRVAIAYDKSKINVAFLFFSVFFIFLRKDKLVCLICSEYKEGTS